MTGFTFTECTDMLLIYGEMYIVVDVQFNVYITVSKAQDTGDSYASKTCVKNEKNREMQRREN